MPSLHLRGVRRASLLAIVAVMLFLSTPWSALATPSVLLTARSGPSLFDTSGTFLSQPSPVGAFAQLELVGNEIWATGGISAGSGDLQATIGIWRFDAQSFAALGGFGHPGAGTGDIVFTGTEVLLSSRSAGQASRWTPGGTFLGFVPTVAPVAQMELVGNEIWALGSASSGTLQGATGIVRYDATTFATIGTLGIPEGGISGDLVFTGSEVLVSNTTSGFRRFAMDGTYLGATGGAAGFAQLERVGNEIWGTGSISGSQLQGSGGVVRYDATSFLPLGSFGVPGGGPSGDLLLVPEPSTSLLVGLGLAGLARARTRGSVA